MKVENEILPFSYPTNVVIIDDDPIFNKNFKLLLDPNLAVHTFHSPSDALGGRRGSQGDAYYVADNPDFGALFSYYVRDELKSLKKLRQEKDRRRQI